MDFSNSNYPPGVTGCESQITGEYPCPACDGAGDEFIGHEPQASCWYCGGSGIMPEMEPKCPNCGASGPDTTFFLQGIFRSWYDEAVPGLLKQQINLAADISGENLDLSVEGIYCTICEEITLA